jgi:hypothetical protein
LEIGGQELGSKQIHPKCSRGLALTMLRKIGCPLTCLLSVCIKKYNITATIQLKINVTVSSDEISMISAHVFDTLDQIGRITRGNKTLPFGGIQVICAGGICAPFFGHFPN